MDFFHIPVIFPLLRPNILLGTMFSDILNLCSFLTVKDQVSLPYKTIEKLVLFTHFNPYFCKWKGGGTTDSPTSICYKFFRKCNLDLLLPSPNIWTLTHRKALLATFTLWLMYCILETRHEHNYIYFSLSLSSVAAFNTASVFCLW
jgi:hypothetical protein